MTINHNNNLTRTIRGWTDLPEHSTIIISAKKHLWLLSQVNYLPWEGRQLPESAWCSIPFNESSAQWVPWHQMLIGSVVKMKVLQKKKKPTSLDKTPLTCSANVVVICRVMFCWGCFDVHMVQAGATFVQYLCNCALIQFVKIAMVCLGTLVCSSTSEVLCSLSDLTSLSTRNTRSQTPNTTSHFPNSKSWQIQICCTSLYNV